jgi:hypothetical protein
VDVNLHFVLKIMTIILRVLNKAEMMTFLNVSSGISPRKAEIESQRPELQQLELTTRWAMESRTDLGH